MRPCCAGSSGSTSVPRMVYVLPLPVWPYANTQEERPRATWSAMPRMAVPNSSSLPHAAGNTLSNRNTSALRPSRSRSATSDPSTLTTSADSPSSATCGRTRMNTSTFTPPATFSAALRAATWWGLGVWGCDAGEMGWGRV